MPLSMRQRQVLQCAAEGKNGLQIAQELCISPQTVRHHLMAARLRLQARTTEQAVAIALTRRLIIPEAISDI